MNKEEIVLLKSQNIGLKKQNFDLQKELLKIKNDFTNLKKEYEQLKNIDIVKKMNELRHKYKCEQKRNSNLIEFYGLKERL